MDIKILLLVTQDNRQNYNDNNKGSIHELFQSVNNKDILKGFHWFP